MHKKSSFPFAFRLSFLDIVCGNSVLLWCAIFANWKSFLVVFHSHSNFSFLRNQINSKCIFSVSGMFIFFLCLSFSHEIKLNVGKWSKIRRSSSEPQYNQWQQKPNYQIFPGKSNWSKWTEKQMENCPWLIVWFPSHNSSCSIAS